MTNVAVLGLGAMGSRMAMNLLKAGHKVSVWNRTPTVAVSLVAAGATQASTPKDAATGAEFVMAMVRDNEASRQIWLDPEVGAFAGMAPGTVAIESSTVTPDWVLELGKNATQYGASLLEAPVSGSTPQAEAAQLIYLVGGEERVLVQAEHLLKVMGSSIHHIGPLGAGAFTKLATNTLLGIQIAVLAELIGMLQRSGADVARIIEAVSATPVWSAVAERAASSMIAGNFTPQFPIELIEKDLGYTVQEAGSPDAAPTIAAARNVFRRGIEEGFGKINMTGVVRLFAELNEA